MSNCIMRDDELRTAHFTENSTDEEIVEVMNNLNKQSLGVMYYDVKASDGVYNAMDSRGELLQLVNHDENNNAVVDENGFVFSGKYDMYDSYGVFRNIDLSEVINRLQVMRDDVKNFVAENKKDVSSANRKLPEGVEFMHDVNKDNEMEM